MTKKEELILLNFAQTLSIGHMIVVLGERLAYDEEVSELRIRINILKQFQLLFEIEYGRSDFNIELLNKIIFLINTLINDFRLEGETLVAEVDILPIRNKITELVLNVISKQGVFKITNSNLTLGTTYSNSALTTSSFILEMTGIGLLTEGEHYELLTFPKRGFKLINGLTLGSSDFIVLTTAFISPEPGGYSDLYALYTSITNQILQPWTDVIYFTFNGSNKTHPLSFAPNSFGAATFMNDVMLNPYSDFVYENDTITINKTLTQGTVYKLITQYYKR